MKEIKAIIQPHMLDKVMMALHSLQHFPGATIISCQGQGRGRGKGGHFEGTTETIFFQKKVMLEIICADVQADELAQVILNAAHTGNAGDGIVAVAAMGRVMRIRDGSEQDQAV